jgi:hypothetical protein
MEISGKIIAILQPRGGVSKAGNEWKMQEYVIETHEQYPKKICFEVFGTEKIEQFKIQIGEELTVSFDVDALQWQDRWFNSFRAWNVKRSTAPQPASQPTSLANRKNDDLPFGDLLADDSPF